MNIIALIELIRQIQYILDDHSFEDDSWKIPEKTSDDVIAGFIERGIFVLFEKDNNPINILEDINLYPSGKIMMGEKHISVGVLGVYKKKEKFLSGLKEKLDKI